MFERGRDDGGFSGLASREERSSVRSERDLALDRGLDLALDRGLADDDADLSADVDLFECDVCGRMRPDTASVWAYGIETIACQDCRDHPPSVDRRIEQLRGEW